MAKTITFLATTLDLPILTAFLEAESPVVINGRFAELPYASQRTLILHFPEIGPLNYWPEVIRPADYPEGTTEWKQAVLLASQPENERKMQIFPNTSACIGFDPPYQKEEGIWVTGTIWFPQENLKDRFPDLARLNGRIERFVAKQYLIFDNTKKDRVAEFPQLFGEAGIVQKVYAFPDAVAQLKKGRPMIDRFVSPKLYREFLRRLELLGMWANQPLQGTPGTVPSSSTEPEARRP